MLFKDNFPLNFTLSFVVYFSTKCKDAQRGKELMIAAKNAIFQSHDDDENKKRALLWSVSYVQDFTQVDSFILIIFM